MPGHISLAACGLGAVSGLRCVTPTSATQQFTMRKVRKVITRSGAADDNEQKATDAADAADVCVFLLKCRPFQQSLRELAEGPFKANKSSCSR